MRWEQFDTLLRGGARMPEPGFAAALYASVTGDGAAAKKAVDWAAQSSGPVRELALVYDWCRASMSPAQAKAVEARLERAAQSNTPGISAARDRVFAALALAETKPQVSENALRDLVHNWWRKGLAVSLESGSVTLRNADLYPLFELLHAVRDNLTIDLREDARSYFRSLGGAYLLGHYPAPYPAAENEYRIAAFKGSAEPDLDAAVLDRAAGLTMVAYDNNSNDSQFLQGWLLMDHFLMRGARGIVYEYLWANPYQPGLSYYHFPLSFHDVRNGRLFARSTWEDDAIWFGLVEGEPQLFFDGKITVLNPRLRQKPVEIGPSMLVMGNEPVRFPAETENPGGIAYVVGLKAGARYNIEIDDEEMWDTQADPGGTVAVPLSPGMKAEIRVSPARKDSQ